MSGQASGFELALDWHPSHWWRIRAGYTYLDLTLELDDDSQDSWQSVEIGENSSPTHQFSLHSNMDLARNWELDLWIYHVDDIPIASLGAMLNDISVDSYTSLNARLGWRPVDDLELSLMGMNLQDDRHSEYVSEDSSNLTEVERSVYAKALWKF